jgi:hypothetical protein
MQLVYFDVTMQARYPGLTANHLSLLLSSAFHLKIDDYFELKLMKRGPSANTGTRWNKKNI